ncbi:thioredoxin domain-containing protein [Candidatus Nomurabacteria bacterium]|nr:thioredoxin domain-containing protein [Candidatus Nomurabacteria bacterium]
MEEKYTSENPYEKKFIDNLPPRSAFKVGLFSGVGAMFAVGFFIMAGLFINQAVQTRADDEKPNVNVNANVNDNAAAANNIANVKVEKDDWLRGDKKADITIVEYSDIDCPYCQKFHETMKQVLADYNGDVNWVYRNFPLTQLHPEAAKKAEIAECVGEVAGNDKLWDYLDYMYANKTALADINTALAKINVNAEKVNSCFEAGKYTQKVQSQISEAVAAGGRGTPYSIIVAGDQRMPINGALPYETIAQQLDALLK